MKQKNNSLLSRNLSFIEIFKGIVYKAQESSLTSMYKCVHTMSIQKESFLHLFVMKV